MFCFGVLWFADCLPVMLHMFYYPTHGLAASVAIVRLNVKCFCGIVQVFFREIGGNMQKHRNKGQVYKRLPNRLKVIKYRGRKRVILKDTSYFHNGSSRQLGVNPNFW